MSRLQLARRAEKELAESELAEGGMGWCLGRRSLHKMLGQPLIGEGGEFLKKLWCCVGGEYYMIIWFYQLS